MDLNDEEIEHLHSILMDEIYRDAENGGRSTSEEEKQTRDLVERFTREAKRRRLWWAR